MDTNIGNPPIPDPVHKKEIAARNVDKSFQIDCNAPRLLDQLSINPQTGSTASGFTDQDYPSFSGMPLAIKNMSQIKCVNNYPLPPEIVDHFTHVQCHCMMGLFSEIGRAWLTVDSDIYVWTYEEHTDLAYFDGINETILCVGLVKPKPGVFHAFIKYLLVLATAVDIVVLGVTFTEGPTESTDEIQLIPDPVFTIPTDGLTVSVISGTSIGRLFYGTKEGSLFEISYQAESGWFGKRCKKVNLSTSTLSFLVPSFLNAALSEEDGISQISIDDSRNILYTLSEKGSIEVCDLGEKGNSFSKIEKMTQATLVNLAMNTVKTLDSQNFRPIVSISAIEATDSANINLVAVSQTGVRFYMSVVSLSNMLPNQRPYTLTLLHVRLPPGYSANVTVRPRMVHISHYSDRNLLVISNVNEKDVLWCMSSDLFPFQQTLMEAYTAINLDGPALAISEVKQEPSLYHPKGEELPPIVVRQHVEAPKKYVILTSHGVQIFTKLRPVDQLKQILISCQGKDSDALRAYFKIQKEDQACATTLILATLQGTDNAWVSQYAASAFFLLGGEPKLAPITTGTTMFAGTTMFQPNIISTPAPHHFQSTTFHTSPNLSQTISPQTSTTYDICGPFIFSAKHNGLYLYLGRILRPLWNRRCIDRVCVDGKTIMNQSTVTTEDCLLVVMSLNDLHKFLSVSIQQSMPQSAILSVRNPNVSMNVTRTNYTESDVQLEERTSLDALKVLVDHSRQIMGLWRILCEHQFHNLIGTLPDNQQQVLQNTLFRDLFMYRADICSILITTLVNSYLGDNASVDSISNKLREVCPDLYKTEDAQYSKASEILKAARAVQNVDEKEEMLHSALELCKMIVPNINLVEVCKEFTSLKAYKAVIELCSHSAKKLDPKQIAESYYNSEDNSADLEGFSYYQKRMEIYRQILIMLEYLYNEQNQNAGQCITCEPQQGANQSVIMDNRDTPVGSVLQHVINEILELPDDIMHFALYEWMGSKNMTSDLIKINNASLEIYLKRSAIQTPDNIDVMDLLWKYYESNNNHAAAAKILNNLASRSGNNVPLKDRLAYLARAIMCMRSDKLGYQPCLGVFLRDLEDKMEVAKVQEQILDTITNMQGQIPNAQEAIAALNSGLYEISQLYENFAEPFKLLECQLAIIDCAGYTDNVLIESIWQEILREQLMRSTGSGSDRVQQVLMKVKNLASYYTSSSHCFPLSYIVYELERVNAKLNGEKHLVSTAFYTMDIPFSQLIAIYNKLITLAVNDHFWQVEENEFHLSLAAAALIDCFITDQQKYNSVEKRKITSLCQDTVSALLSNLYSKPNTDQLVKRLRGIQAQLSRI